MHTLDENHAHLLSASFDASLNQSSNLAVPSSSQFDAGFGYVFDDNFFGMSDGLDFGGEIGDELARELGEGWGGVSSMSMAEWVLSLNNLCRDAKQYQPKSGCR